MLAEGADQTVDRNTDLVRELGRSSVDVVIDVVGGPGFPQLLDVLRPGGRYAVSGAIAGPLAEIDLRTLYLKDLSLFGCTFQDDEVFENLVAYLESGEVRPVVSRSYPLAEIAQAQRDFLDKSHVGKLVLIPPARGRASGPGACSRTSVPAMSYKRDQNTHTGTAKRLLGELGSSVEFSAVDAGAAPSQPLTAAGGGPGPGRLPRRRSPSAMPDQGDRRAGVAHRPRLRSAWAFTGALLSIVLGIGHGLSSELHHRC